MATDDLQTRQTAFAKTFNLSLDDYLFIVSNNSLETITTLLELLRPQTFRSPIRENAAAKLRRWLDNKLVSTPPLTRAELESLTPSWPITWKLPT